MLVIIGEYDMEPFTEDTAKQTFKLEKDEEASHLLDSLILYLRVVHSIDYYNATEYQQEESTYFY